MLKKSDANLKQFGEIYSATAYPGVVKGWHLHTKQEQNYDVISGMIKLVLFDDREESKTKGELMETSYRKIIIIKLLKLPRYNKWMEKYRH